MIVDLLELLCLAVLHFPLLLGMGLSMECGMGDGCDCAPAGCTGTVCSRTVCSNGGPSGTPCTYQVELSGMVDGNCPANNCEALDGVYSFTIPAGCEDLSGTPAPANMTSVWNGASCDSSSAPTEVTDLRFLIAPAAINFRLGYSIFLGPANTHQWQYDGAAVDCSSLSSFNLPWVNDTYVSGGSGSGASCDGSGATALITAVP